MKITLSPLDWSEEDMVADPSSVHPVVILVHPQEDMSIEEVWTELVRPALIAWGFHPDTVDSLVEKVT